MSAEDHATHLVHVSDNEAIVSKEVLGSDLVADIAADIDKDLDEITVGGESAEQNPSSSLYAFPPGRGRGRGRSRSSSRSRSRSSSRSRSRSRSSSRSRSRSRSVSRSRSRVSSGPSRRGGYRGSRARSTRARSVSRSRSRSSVSRRSTSRRSYSRSRGRTSVSRRSRGPSRRYSRASSRRRSVSRRSRGPSRRYSRASSRRRSVSRRSRGPSRRYSRATTLNRRRTNANRAALFQSARQTGQYGPTRHAASIAGASLAGYRTSGINSQRFGQYNSRTGRWSNGYTLDQYRNIRTNGRVNPAYTSMMGSQAQYMSARQTGGVRGARFEVNVPGTSRVADYQRGRGYTETKMGSSFNPGQFNDYVRSNQRVHYDFRSSPLSNSARRQSSNYARVQAAGANTGGRVTASQGPGPTRAHVRAVQSASYANTALRGASRVAVPAAIALDAYSVGRAYRADGGRVGTQTKGTLSSVGGSWAGAAAGGVAGAKAGAVVGTFIGGPVGTAVGGVVGGVVGAVGGAIAGSSIGRSVYGWFSGNKNSSSQSLSNRTSTRTNSLSPSISSTSVAQNNSTQKKKGWGSFFGFG